MPDIERANQSTRNSGSRNSKHTAENYHVILYQYLKIVKESNNVNRAMEKGWRNNSYQGTTILVLQFEEKTCEEGK